MCFAWNSPQQSKWTPACDKGITFQGCSAMANSKKDIWNKQTSVSAHRMRDSGGYLMIRIPQLKSNLEPDLQCRTHDMSELTTQMATTKYADKWINFFFFSLTIAWNLYRNANKSVVSQKKMRNSANACLKCFFMNAFIISNHQQINDHSWMNVY